MRAAEERRVGLAETQQSLLRLEEKQNKKGKRDSTKEKEQEKKQSSKKKREDTLGHQNE